MEELFSNNIFVIYAIACIAVISYTNFKENQRMFLLFLFTYGTAFFGVFQIPASLLLLLIITFVFLEYLTEDTAKLNIIIKLPYKVFDYLFMMFFQYHFVWVILASFVLYISRLDNIPSILGILLKIVSIAFFCAGAHLTISQPFKVKTITEIHETFDKCPIYAFEYQEEMLEKFELLCAFEDKTYFDRKKSYSCISLEYAKCWIKSHSTTGKVSPTALISALHTKGSVYRLVSRLSKRGYSTPEMQLLRSIGISRGYDKYKVSRKVFEILYTKIFFSSLKDYHKANTYSDLTHYRHYLLYIYFRTVLTRINGKRCMPLSSAFSNPNDVSNWSMNGLFVACLGLSFRQVSEYNLALYSDIIEYFNLDETRIKQLSSLYPDNRFPSEDTSYAKGTPLG